MYTIFFDCSIFHCYVLHASIIRKFLYLHVHVCTCMYMCILLYMYCTCMYIRYICLDSFLAQLAKDEEEIKAVQLVSRIII